LALTLPHDGRIAAKPFFLQRSFYNVVFSSIVVVSEKSYHGSEVQLVVLAEHVAVDPSAVSGSSVKVL
jgi:hypothetical protein